MCVSCMSTVCCRDLTTPFKPSIFADIAPFATAKFNHKSHIQRWDLSLKLIQWSLLPDPATTAKPIRLSPGMKDKTPPTFWAVWAFSCSIIWNKCLINHFGGILAWKSGLIFGFGLSKSHFRGPENGHFTQEYSGILRTYMCSLLLFQLPLPISQVPLAISGQEFNRLRQEDKKKTTKNIKKFNIMRSEGSFALLQCF